MQKNDFFAIVYRVLAHLYYLMQEGKKLSSDDFMYDDALFGINEGYWENIMEFFSSNGYVDGVTCYLLPSVPCLQVELKETVSITPRGIEYLQEDRMMHKARRFYQNR